MAHHKGLRRSTKDKTGAGCRLMMLFCLAMFPPTHSALSWDICLDPPIRANAKLAIKVSQLLVTFCQVNIPSFSSQLKLFCLYVMVDYVPA